MAETRTVAETDGLLEALSAACRERDAARRELQETQVAHHAAEAECIDLRAESDLRLRLGLHWRERADAADTQLAHALAEVEQMRAASRPRPSLSFTLGHLIGVTIGAALVGGAAGVEVALRWLSW